MINNKTNAKKRYLVLFLFLLLTYLVFFIIGMACPKTQNNNPFFTYYNSVAYMLK